MTATASDEATETKGNKKLIIIIVAAAAVVLLAAGFVAFMMLKPKTVEADPAKEPGAIVTMENAMTPELRIMWESWADRSLPAPSYETAGAAGADIRANLPQEARSAGITLHPMQRLARAAIQHEDFAALGRQDHRRRHAPCGRHVDQRHL